MSFFNHFQLLALIADVGDVVSEQEFKQDSLIIEYLAVHQTSERKPRLTD